MGHANRFSFLSGIGLIAFLILFGCNNKIPAGSAKAKPNILIILVDDAGYADFGFMGSKDLQTPNIDQLASRAVRFTDAHVSSSVCSPSRAGLITGRYQQRFGYECNEGDGYTGLDIGQRTIAESLKSGGYETAAIGKWHLGFAENQTPLARGFNYHYGFLAGSRSYFYKPLQDDKANSKRAILENGKEVSFDGYLTDVLAEKAVSFMSKKRDKPFFVYWAPNAVHTPMDATESDLALFKDHPRQKLAAMTFALDRAVGKMMSALQKNGILDNTLVFFLSDNGGAHDNQSINIPLKGFKGNEFEAGHRIPFLLSWPKKFSGKIDFHGLTSSLDIYATCMEAAGIPLPKENKLDGASLLSFIERGKDESPHQWLFWRKDGFAAARNGSLKLIRANGLGYRLYDLKDNLNENQDLQQANPSLFTSMKNGLEEWESDKMKPIWTEGAIWDTITLMIHDDLMNNRKVRVADPKSLNEFRSLH